jgi:SAM-dependent MidA family methyltransferase
MADYFDDYKDVDFGWLDDVIDRASFPFYAYVIASKYIDNDGSEKVTYTRYTIKGSLQAFRRERNYDTDGSRPNTSSKKGKFYAKYNVRLKENDLIQKIDDGSVFRVVQVIDYGYVGVRNYEVERLGIDQLYNYNFSEFVEDDFPEGIIEG